MLVGGFDIGQKTDHSVLVTLRDIDDGETWLVEDVCQLPLGLPFKEQLARLQSRLDNLDMLAIDSGGTGQAVAEIITGANLKKTVPIVIMGGTSKGKLVKGRVVVGKSYLVQGVLNMIATGWLAVAPDAGGRDVLQLEMKAFQYKPGGRFRKAEAAPGEHDDAVMALSLAAYLARTLVRV